MAVATTKVCSHCNGRIGAGAEVCPCCGEQLGEAKSLGESLEGAGSWVTQLVFWLVMLGLIVGCLALAGVFS